MSGVIHQAEGTMPSVFVVDDEDQIRQLIRETLE
jgi:CheY-like chemotaxis protein